MVTPDAALSRLTMEGYAADGSAVARLDGQAVFVSGALAGEVCGVRIEKRGRSALWGRAETVLDPSPERRTPDCPHFPLCGGCTLRHMSYEEELRFKRGRIEDALRRIGRTEVPVSVIFGAKNTQRYRNKAVFPVQPGPFWPSLGFYRGRSHEVVDVPDCLLQSEAAARLRGAVKQWMARFGVPAYDERTGAGLIRHLFVRTNGAGESLCALAVNGPAVPHEAELAALLRAAEPGLRGLVLAENAKRTNVIFDGSFRTLWGEGALSMRLCGLEFRLDAPSFFQVNTAQAEVLYTRVLALAQLRGGETALDLYCGVGTITLLLARAAGRVFGAEVVPQAVANARENAVRNGLENASFFCGDAAQAAAELARRGVRPDVVVVDPPRKGLSPAVIDTLAQMAPERLVYVSCDPGTLARDIGRFAPHGYLPRRVEAVDLFPRTSHVETVCLLSKPHSEHYIEVNLNLDEMDLTASESKATYEEIKSYVLEQTGLNVSHLYIAQVKRKNGIIERENYNKRKNEEATQPQCPPDKEKAITDALKHFGMLTDRSS